MEIHTGVKQRSGGEEKPFWLHIILLSLIPTMLMDVSNTSQQACNSILLVLFLCFLNEHLSTWIESTKHMQMFAASLNVKGISRECRRSKLFSVWLYLYIDSMVTHTVLVCAISSFSCLCCPLSNNTISPSPQGPSINCICRWGFGWTIKLIFLSYLTGFSKTPQEVVQCKN